VIEVSFNRDTQTMNIGSHNWLSASKRLQIRSYLSTTVSNIDPTMAFEEQDIQFRTPITRLMGSPTKTLRHNPAPQDDFADLSQKLFRIF
jgi:hypothetical protein